MRSHWNEEGAAGGGVTGRGRGGEVHSHRRDFSARSFSRRCRESDQSGKDAVG